MKQITSLANPEVKALKALALKKHRDETKTFLAEGLKLIIDALDQGWDIRAFIHAHAGKDNPILQQTAARTLAAGGDVIEVPEKVMAAIVRRDNPQMAAAVFAQRWTPIASLKPRSGDVHVALDRVRDPGNLGTILRTADAVGAKSVILVGETTDPFSPETVRATMGSVFSVPVARATPDGFASWANGSGAFLAGTHLKGAVDYRKVAWTDRPVVLLMGNEQAGLPDALAGACDVLVRIPQAGRADSLNLAVATAVMLFEIRRDALVLDGDGA